MKNRLKPLLKNPYILITGGTGFTGSHIAEALSKYSKNIIVTFRQQRNSYFFLQNLDKKVHLKKIDIRNKKSLFRLGDEYPIEYIIHFAANTDVTNAYQNPFHTLDVNINGTINVLELARLNKNIKGTIIVSSDKAYGKTKKKVLNETSPIGGDHPYEVAKATTDLLAQSYYKTYNLPIIVTRFGNIYGEGDIHFERLIPGICKSIITNSPLIIRSNGNFIRNYVYIKDVVNGYLMLLNQFPKIKYPVLNFASDEALSTIAVIKLFEKVLKKKVPYHLENIAVNEIPYQKLDSSRAHELGWKTEYTIKLTASKIFTWYKNYFLNTLKAR